jgi:hypothetical protein
MQESLVVINDRCFVNCSAGNREIGDLCYLEFLKRNGLTNDLSLIRINSKIINPCVKFRAGIVLATMTELSLIGNADGACACRFAPVIAVTLRERSCSSWRVDGSYVMSLVTFCCFDVGWLTMRYRAT